MVKLKSPVARKLKKLGVSYYRTNLVEQNPTLTVRELWDQCDSLEFLLWLLLRQEGYPRGPKWFLKLKGQEGPEYVWPKKDLIFYCTFDLYDNFRRIHIEDSDLITKVNHYLTTSLGCWGQRGRAETMWRMVAELRSILRERRASMSLPEYLCLQDLESFLDFWRCNPDSRYWAARSGCEMFSFTAQKFFDDTSEMIALTRIKFDRFAFMRL